MPPHPLQKHRHQVSNGLPWIEISHTCGSIFIAESTLCDPSWEGEYKEACIWIPPDSTHVFPHLELVV